MKAKKKKKKKKEERKELNKVIIKSIESIPLSILTLLFGPFYLLYKKLYSPAIITLILYLATSIYLTFELNIIIKLIINIYLSIKYYKTLKNSKDNINIYIPILVLVLYIIIIMLINIQGKDNYNKTDNHINNMTYTIPDNIKEYKSSKNHKYFILNDYNKGNCIITISSNNSNMYSIPEEYISDSQKFVSNYKKSKIKKITINNNTWTKQSLKNNMSYIELYVIMDENIIYEIKFESSNSKKDLCDSSKNKLLK